MPLAAGTHLGPYEILSTWGACGMGEVDRARDMRLKREVAVKILPPEFAADAARRLPDGRMVALRIGNRSTLWRFTPEAR